jgi:hypothetical protein
MMDLQFFSNPTKLTDDIIKIVEPNGTYEYVDSVYNMENGELMDVAKVKHKYYGFYRGAINSRGTYFLIYSKDEKGDEYSYSIFLNIYDKGDSLQSSQRIYSSSDVKFYRNFCLKKNTLVLVDYAPKEQLVTVGNKTKKLFTTEFEITTLLLPEDSNEYINAGVVRTESPHSPDVFKNSDTYVTDDPLAKIN